MGDSEGLSGQKEVKLGNSNVENEVEKTFELSPKHFTYGSETSFTSSSSHYCHDCHLEPNLLALKFA